ncbi:9737_t:CDS:2, partial [Cetraspora pellucida]
NSAIEFESDFNFMSSHSSNPIIEPEGVLNLTLNQSFSNPPENDFIVTPGPSSSSNDISSDDESQENLLQLYVGLPFNTWEEVDSFVESYGKVLGQLNNATNQIVPKTVYTDADLAMGAALKNMWPTTHHSHCIFHLNNNFVKKLKPIMGKSFEECYQLFYSSRNSLLEIDFERRWMRFVEFVEPFPKAHRYAIETLYPTRHSWAVCYTQTRFTAGIQSTQRVEGINAIIKREVSHSSTLLHLIDAIQNRLDEEARYARISEQKNMNPSIGLPHIASRYFSGIDSLLKEYLTPHVLSLQ